MVRKLVEKDNWHYKTELRDKTFLFTFSFYGNDLLNLILYLYPTYI